jgi:protein-disulfide isomerase
MAETRNGTAVANESGSFPARIAILADVKGTESRVRARYCDAVPSLGHAPRVLSGIALVLALLSPFPAFAQDTSSCGPAKSSSSQAQDAPMSRAQADEMLQELKQIRALLEQMQKQGVAEAAKTPARVPSGPASLKLAPSRPALGSEHSPVTVVEFADYQCPYWHRFQSDIFLELKSKYIDTGKVRFITRNLPLDIHPGAKKAALVSLCAGEQGKYWDIRNALAERSAALNAAALSQIAADAHLDPRKFTACVDSGKYNPEIAHDLADAASIGVNGTPSFIIGRVNDSNNVVTGTVIRGALPIASFTNAIDEALKQ